MVAFLFAGMVVLGLVAEFVLALVNSHDPEIVRWGPVGCDFFVALGVAGEVWFSRRDAKCMGERLERSDSQLGIATMLASTGEARAADAQREAAEARLETERLKAATDWRHLTAEQRAQIIKYVRPIASKVNLWVENLATDIEAWRYANELAYAFHQAGVPKENIAGKAVLLSSGPTFGAWVKIHGLKPWRFRRAFAGLPRPFAVIEEDFGLKLVTATWRPTVYLYVGPRGFPDMFDGWDAAGDPPKAEPAKPRPKSRTRKT